MAVTKRTFGFLPDGREVSCYILTNGAGMEARVLDYGVTLQALIVPDRNGDPVDVALGYDTLEEYRQHRSFLGATVGRFANRIGKASFVLNGKEYKLAANSKENHIHGGNVGFDKYIWNARMEENGVVFSMLSPDGDEGYPGNLQLQVTVSLTQAGLRLHYRAVSDQDTIVNFTNHSYFNLDGAGDIMAHRMQLQADLYTVNDADGLPTGQLLPVEGTPFDFRTEKAMGRDMVDGFSGYDNNMILTGNPAAVVCSEASGIVMTMSTDQPGVQFYTANSLYQRTGKGGAQYGPRSGFCLETQHYPDCIHHPDWPSCILRAGEVFESTTTYEFSVE